MPKRLSALLLLALLLVSFPAAQAITCSFKNPLIPFGQDPSVVYQDGYYYLVQSGATGLTIAKSDTITGLGRAEPVVVFNPPPGQPYSYDLWAPELVYLDGEWYIYVAATEAPGNNPTHRMYVLQADTDDPQGTWTMKGKVYDPENDKWAIDGSVFEYDGRLFMVWSGWPGDVGDFPQNTYIAEMSDPFTLSSPRVLISEPDQPWENSIAAIQEGHQPFIHDGQLSIVYSADASWTRFYKLGMLTLTGDDPLDPAAWTKIGPVMDDNESGGVFGVGHSSSPIPSPDGSESWLFYHAKTIPQDGWGDRAIRAEAFTWSEDGTPQFDVPTPVSGAEPLPSGEPCGLVATSEESDTTTISATLPPETSSDDVYQLDEAFIDTGAPFINTLGSFSVAARAQLAETGDDVAIISQDGGINSNFVLGFTGGEFSFTFHDPMRPSVTTISSSVQPEAGVWYHLVGVRDALTGQILLYVDGELAATAEYTAAWDARGSTLIGASRQQTQRVGLFSGLIDDVYLYNGALDASEIGELYREASQEAG